jgi:hypothetical protein
MALNKPVRRSLLSVLALAGRHTPAATPAFEFRRWTAFLNPREQKS